MELSPVGGAAQAAAGTYTGQWHLVVVDSKGVASDLGDKPGSVTLSPGADLVDKEGNPTTNADAATAVFDCEFFAREDQPGVNVQTYSEHVNVAKTAQGFVFFQKFESYTQIEAAFAGSVGNEGNAAIKFTKKELVNNEGRLTLSLRHYEFHGSK